MLEEFRAEWNGDKPFRPKWLTPAGLAAYPGLMEQAIQSGNEVTLTRALERPGYIKAAETGRRGAKTFSKRTPHDAARIIGESEFNVWYTRGFAKRLLKEGEEECEVYRAAPAAEPRDVCTFREGRRFQVRDVYNSHRAEYWPRKKPGAFMIPAGVNCHHTIRRVRKTAVGP